ncbi:MAG: tripartite tricarboxylate transporter substrate binding protein [Burkholderiales bacterium]
MKKKSGGGAVAPLLRWGGLLIAAVAMVTPAQSADWPANGMVEIVVPSGPASGLDTAGRTIKNLFDAAKLVSTPSVVINKPGAGGTIAYQYLNQRPGNGRYLAIASPSLVTNKLMGIGDVDARDMTAVCRLFSDNIVFMVRADSAIQDGKALIARLRKNPAAASFGIATALGGANHIAAAAVLKDSGIDVKGGLYVGYKSGADALVALLSGEVDVVPVAAPVSLPQLAGGKVRVIAVSSPERLGGALAGVPTWKEQGIDSVYTSWRVIVAPRGVSDEEARVVAAAFAKMVAMPQWKAELEKNYWIGSYAGPEVTRKFLEEQANEHRLLLTQLGLAKQGN